MTFVAFNEKLSHFCNKYSHMDSGVLQKLLPLNPVCYCIQESNTSTQWKNVTRSSGPKLVFEKMDVHFFVAQMLSIRGAPRTGRHLFQIRPSPGCATSVLQCACLTVWLIDVSNSTCRWYKCCGSHVASEQEVPGFYRWGHFFSCVGF